MPICKHDSRETIRAARSCNNWGFFLVLLCVLAAIDARTAEARCIDLQQAERAVPSGKWVLSLAPPRFQVNITLMVARGTQANEVVSSARRQRALAVKSFRVLGCQSVHSVVSLLGPACWGQGASQSHPEGKLALTMAIHPPATCFHHHHHRHHHHHHYISGPLGCVRSGRT